MRKITSIGRGQLLTEGRRTLDEPTLAKQDQDDWQNELKQRLERLALAQGTLADYTADQRRISPLQITSSNEASAKVREYEIEAATNPAADFAAIQECIENACRVPRLLGRVITRLVCDLMPRQVVEVHKCEWLAAEAFAQVCLYEGASVAAEFISYAEPMAEALGASAIEPPPKLAMYEERALKAVQAERTKHELYIKANCDLTALLQAEQRAMI